VQGNPFPVTEDHRGAKKLVGSAIKSGFQSHYVLTNRDGMVFNREDGSEGYDGLFNGMPGVRGGFQN
jgi:hypothetical protein